MKRKIIDFFIKNDGRHIKINFFGIKINIRHSVNRKIFNNFMQKEVLPKTILIIEINKCHYETIPGLCKFCLDIGYNVDILTRGLSDKIFDNFSSSKVRVYECNEKTFDKIYEEYDFSKYNRVIYNSKVIYTTNKMLDISDFYKVVKRGKNKSIFLQHHIEKYDETPNDLQIVLANPAKRIDLDSHVVNCHYFKESPNKLIHKNSIVNFISIGELSIRRRNISLLINAIKNLHSKGITNFKVTIIGRGELKDISGEIRSYFDILGRVDYQTMFNEIMKSDFILPLLDPEVEAHKRYMESGTSGTFLLVYGFNKPCIIHKTFADIYGFNEQNSLVYENNSMFDAALINAINLEDKIYLKLQENLKALSVQISNTSEYNLKMLLSE